MGTALLVDLYNLLPQPRDGDDGPAWENRLHQALDVFKRKVSERYTEGTLERLLHNGCQQTRRAATAALGLLGTMTCNEALASRLHDDDPLVRRLAADALWALWFRADSPAHNQELQRLTRLRDRDQALAGLDALILKAPAFAEAYNQRAILYFKRREYPRSIADCEKVVGLNPVHFGAYAGMAQGFLNLRKPRAALRAFREAFRINPNLDGVEETIRDLEHVLGEEGRKDER